MIRRVWSSLEKFREPRFDLVGMGVVSANRGAESSETDSTNGLGKSTLLRIIQFALGSDLSRDRVLNHPELSGVTFGMDLAFNGGTIVISRNTATPTKIRVSKDFLADLPLDFEIDGHDAVINLDAWRLALAYCFLPDALVDRASNTFAPTFRELAVYFVRLGKEAYADPQQAFHNQKGASKRLAVSYLLGLNWTAQRSLHDLLSERERVSTALNAVSEAAEVSDDESIGELEAERVVRERALEKRQEEIANFNLRSDYHDLEQRLNIADKTLHELVNDNYADRRLLQYYRESAVEAPLFDANRPVSLLQDAGAVFKSDALRSLDEVAAFHSQVYRNRAEFLAGELNRLTGAIARRDRLIDGAAASKAQLLKALSASGALETLIELQRTTSEMAANLEGLKAKIDERKRFDRRKDELTASIGAARTLLKHDLDQRRGLVDESIELFAEYTRALYGKSARLGVDVKDAGYKFTFSIDRQGSDGVDQMVVFCFDLMVATLRSRRGAPFKILIHDSSLFADVDPRQYGLALQLAADVSAGEGFQYICCLNEGTVPRDHLGELDLETLTRLRLTDDGPEGRLLGVKLSPREVA